VKRTRIVVAGAAGALLLLTGGVAAALDGDSPSSTGWWSSEPGAAAQPGSGFQVGAVGGSATSVAALRFTIPSSATSAKLSLQETDGGVVTPATALQACVTTDSWQAANPGAMADAPKADCAQNVPLARDETTKVWSAEVGSLLLGGGDRSLMIVPGTTANGGSPVDPGFRVVFSEAKLAVVAGADDSTSRSPEVTPSGGSSGSTGGYDFGSSGSSSSGFQPSTGSGTPTDIGAVTPSAPAPSDASTTATTVASSQDSSSAAPSFKADGSGGGGADQPWARLLILIPLSALAGVGTVYGKRMLAERGVVESG
jgi:hypothetical protein